MQLIRFRSFEVVFRRISVPLGDLVCLRIILVFLSRDPGIPKSRDPEAFSQSRIPGFTPRDPGIGRKHRRKEDGGKRSFRGVCML